MLLILLLLVVNFISYLILILWVFFP